MNFSSKHLSDRSGVTSSEAADKTVSRSFLCREVRRELVGHCQSNCLFVRRRRSASWRVCGGWCELLLLFFRLLLFINTIELGAEIYREIDRAECPRRSRGPLPEVPVYFTIETKPGALLYFHCYLFLRIILC